MAVHNVIQVEIKQTKMNFFCLHFNPVFSRNSLTTHVLQKYVLEKIEHVHHIGVSSHFAYVEPRITRSIFAIPLDFEIARLTCNMIWEEISFEKTQDGCHDGHFGYWNRMILDF